MAEDRIGKLFLLAMSSNSDAEALSALEMIRATLKKRGLDAHAIADALNRASSGPGEDNSELGSSLRSFTESSDAPSYPTDWDREKEAQDIIWEAATYGPFQSTESTPIDYKRAEQETDAQFSATAGANPWLTESNWEQDAEEAFEAEKERYDTDAAGGQETSPERQAACAANVVSKSGHNPSMGQSIPGNRKRRVTKLKKRMRGKFRKTAKY